MKPLNQTPKLNPETKIRVFASSERSGLSGPFSSLKGIFFKLLSCPFFASLRQQHEHGLPHVFQEGFNKAQGESPPGICE